MDKLRTYDPRFAVLKKSQKNGKNSATILQDNRNLVLQLIYENGSISRKQLAELSGLQHATITIIIKELLAQGVVQENGRTDGGNGRTVQTFTIDPELCIISVRITAVYIKVALFNIKMENLYAQKVFFQTEDTISESIALILEGVTKIESKVKKEKILGIAIGVEHKYKLIDDDYYVWDEYRQDYCSIGKKIHDATKYAVFSNRSINFSTYQMADELIKNNSYKKECHVLVNINVSYELESAIIINNEILYGKDGRCGQMNNVRISRKNDLRFKDVVTVPAILGRIRELQKEYPGSCIEGIEDLNIRDVIAGYHQKDALCRAVYDEICNHLGYGIAEVISWLDPDVVVVGDEIPNTEEFTQTLRGYVDKYSCQRVSDRVLVQLRERITPNDPALSGGAKYTFDRIINEIGIC